MPHTPFPRVGLRLCPGGWFKPESKPAPRRAPRQNQGHLYAPGAFNSTASARLRLALRHALAKNHQAGTITINHGIVATTTVISDAKLSASTDADSRSASPNGWSGEFFDHKAAELQVRFNIKV